MLARFNANAYLGRFDFLQSSVNFNVISEGVKLIRIIVYILLNSIQMSTIFFVFFHDAMPFEIG